MKISVITKLPNKTSGTLVLTYFFKDKFASHPFLKLLKKGDRTMIQHYFAEKIFSGKFNEVRILPLSSKKRIVLLGLGEKNKWNSHKLILAIRRLVTVVKAEKLDQIVVHLGGLAVLGYELEKLAQTTAENSLMANYEFTQYRSNPDKQKDIKNLVLVVDKTDGYATKKGIAFGLVIGTEVNAARALGNIPGSEMTPKLLATKAQEAGRQAKFSVKALDEVAMGKLKMGAILGVAKGSHERPRLIVMQYNGGKREEQPYVFVGKGVTFDSGGLNLKPGKGMSDMHLDMVGGAAVISALSVIAKLKLPVNVVGIVPAVENMLGGGSYRPGDLLKSMSGKTIEIINTDAEGRVILADALTYAEQFKPEVVVDVATLTGACMVALGLNISGLMTTHPGLQEDLIRSGEMSGDYVWPLPMWEEFEDDVKGTFADVQNEGRNSPYAGAISGAMFLKQFAGKAPWAHLDIAGPMKTSDGQYLSKGASGVGVRLLVEFIRGQLAKKITKV